jgi:RNA recognition motif-containing protein
MKDRVSGKSRGFGFVTFVEAGCASAALQMEHTIDGRRCEAKVALPKVRAYKGRRSGMSSRWMVECSAAGLVCSSILLLCAELCNGKLVRAG